jgi:hypothetical protein
MIYSLGSLHSEIYLVPDLHRTRYSKAWVGGLLSYAKMEFYIFRDVKAEMFNEIIATPILWKLVDLFASKTYISNPKIIDECDD